MFWGLANVLFLILSIRLSWRPLFLPLFPWEMCLAKGNALVDVQNTFTLVLKPPKEGRSHLDIVYALLPLKLSLPILPLNFPSCTSLGRIYMNLFTCEFWMFRELLRPFT